MTYTKQVWKDGESWVNQDTLSHMEEGIYAAHQANNIKQFHTTVNAVDGAWSCDYSAAGFTKILAIQATGQASDTSLSSRTIAGLGNVEPTLTSCSGVLMSATSGGLLAVTTLISASGKVHVSVFGE